MERGVSCRIAHETDSPYEKNTIIHAESDSYHDGMFVGRIEVGEYTPDWRVEFHVFDEDGDDRAYFLLTHEVARELLKALIVKYPEVSKLVGGPLISVTLPSEDSHVSQLEHPKV